MLDRVGLPGFADRSVRDPLGRPASQHVRDRPLPRARADPRVLLDGQLGALDLKLREQMKLELKEIQATFNTSFVYITHDQSEALVMSDRVAVMNAGRFEQVGPPRELYHHPATRFVAGFVGETNQSTAGAGASLRLGGGAPFRAAASSRAWARSMATGRPLRSAGGDRARDRSGWLPGPAEPLRRPRLGGALRRRELVASHRCSRSRHAAPRRLAAGGSARRHPRRHRGGRGVDA